MAILSGLKSFKMKSHETTIFGLKMMVKSGLEFFYFEILCAPSELLLLVQVSLKGHVGFQKKKI